MCRSRVGIQPDKNNNNIPDKAEDVVPNQELAKNPLIENTGSNSAVVFLKVTVPTKYVTPVADDGTVSKDGRKSQRSSTSKMLLMLRIRKETTSMRTGRNWLTKRFRIPAQQLRKTVFVLTSLVIKPNC